MAGNLSTLRDLWSLRVRAVSTKLCCNRGVTMIRKLKSGKYRLYSRKKNPKTGKRRNLGTFDTLEQAKKRERAVNASNANDLRLTAQRGSGNSPFGNDLKKCVKLFVRSNNCSTERHNVVWVEVAHHPVLNGLFLRNCCGMIAIPLGGRTLHGAVQPAPHAARANSLT